MKKPMLLFTAVSVLMLSGCSVVDKKAQEMIKEQGIEGDEDYKEYTRLKSGGELDENGYYKISDSLSIEETEETVEQRTGQIRVTFAENDNLLIHYYRDAEQKEEILTSCYLNPNDYIYASVPESMANTNLYHFLEYRIFEYGESGRKQLDWTAAEENVVLQIPADYSGEEISVVPVGGYEKRKLMLSDYYMDTEGNSHELSERWRIDKEETAGDSITISPVDSYILSYEYDNKNYFFVDSHPDCRYQDNEDGVVIFEEADAQSEITNYSVELHPYISAEIISDQEWRYQVNGGEQMKSKKGSQKITNLKYEDQIVVYTDKVAVFDYDKNQLTEPAEIQVAEGYCYTFQVKKHTSFYFDPSEYTYSYGSIVFKNRGREITEGVYLGEGSQITYEAKSVEEGYWLPDGDHTIVVKGEKETKEAFNQIRFYPQRKVEVYLLQPKAGGTIRYSVNGTEIETSSIEVDAGTSISMDFEGWEGWICSAEDKTLYIAGEEDKQETNVKGKDVDQIFLENEEHKPVLELVLDKSVGEMLQVDLSASGYEKSGIVYQQELLKNTYTLSTEKIGTEEGITVSLKNGSVQSGYAFKIKMVKTEKNKNQSEEVLYIQKIPVSEKLEIYHDTEIMDSPFYYDKVTITISLEEVEGYEPKSIEHGEINLAYADTGAEVQEGEILDGEREVVVSIIPEEGYYLDSGKKNTNDLYQNTMSYKKYKSDIDKIIKDNPIKKIFIVTLDNNDPYGTVVYKLDGAEVSGTIEVREKQKLVMEYMITDSEYEIQTEGLLKIVQSKTKGDVSIEITEEIDGTVLKREDFITVMKKGD